MFSMTTMASSMRIPIDSDSASIVMLLKVKPITSTNQNVATTELGMASRADQGGADVVQEEQDDQDRQHAAEQRSNFTSLIECSM